MIIEGKLNTYKVQWRKVDFTYADPVIYVKVKIPFLPLSRWKEVWQDKNSSLIKENVELMLPNEIRSWFDHSVMKYEKWKMAWDEEYKTQDISKNSLIKRQ